MSGARRATLQEVAAQAGVSAAVVSLVLNGKDNGRFLPETVERVHAASRRLGYRVDRRARSLTTGKSGLIALIVPDTTNPFFASVQMGILDALGADYQLLTVATFPEDETALENAQAVLDHGVDGMLIATRGSVASATLPTVVLDLPGEGEAHARVNLDVASTARQLAHEMLRLEHRNVVYVESSSPSATLADRHLAFKTTMQAAGATVTSDHTLLNIEAAEEAVAARLPKWSAAGVSAIVCATDIQAYGCLAALRGGGFRVPDDFSLVGGDDLPYSRLMTPPLASVRLPSRELGRVGARRLIQEINGGQGGDSVVTLPTALELRPSLSRNVSTR